MGNKAEQVDSEDRMDTDPNQLNNDDDDFKIHFDDKKSLLEHLSHLEEDNLFKIHLV